MRRLILTSSVQYAIDKITFLFDKPISDTRIVCIPTAAYGEDNFDEWRPEELQAFTNIGFNLE